jgi:hypothetical protein
VTRIEWGEAVQQNDRCVMVSLTDKGMHSAERIPPVIVRHLSLECLVEKSSRPREHGGVKVGGVSGTNIDDTAIFHYVSALSPTLQRIRGERRSSRPYEQRPRPPRREQVVRPPGPVELCQRLALNIEVIDNSDPP